MTEPSAIPILFIVFNRLDTAAVVFKTIQDLKPQKLFIAADGPRLNVAGENERCQAVKDYLLKNINWTCQVETLFSATNLGIPLALQSALDWFFKTNDRGIILEHDCLPNASFFRFCAANLDRYQAEERIMHISGNFFQPQKIGDADYYFSRIPHIWGWATWRRAWKKYDLTMATYEQFLKNKTLRQFFPHDYEQTVWRQLFNQVYYHKSATWDFQWTYALFQNDGLAITPNQNLVKNIGFGPDAVNCQDKQSPLANLTTAELSFPLRSPEKIAVNLAADEYTTRHNFGFGALKYSLTKLGLFNFFQSFYHCLKNK